MNKNTDLVNPTLAFLLVVLHSTELFLLSSAVYTATGILQMDTCVGKVVR